MHCNESLIINRKRQIILLIVWCWGSPDASHLARLPGSSQPGRGVMEPRAGRGSFLPTDPTLLCGLGLLLGDREIFFQEKKKKKRAEKSIVSSVTWGERGFKSPWSGRQRWLKANKGNHFKLDELRERRSFEALEKSQKVTFLPFNINVRLNP